MSDAVVFLESRRRRPQEAARCELCASSRNGGCYPHRLEALTRRLMLVLDSTQEELLIDREVLAAAVEDARAVLDPIVGECLPDDMRGTR